AAMLKINPSTAYLMLKTFTSLSPGDVVIQNGANSGVGRSLIQIARSMDITTVNVIRKREGLEDLKRDLSSLGADHVLTEEELRSTDLFKSQRISKAKLAFNCVGGASSTEIGKCLEFRGKHITYGGMSMKPVTAATSSLIFKDISFHGFWLSRWFEEHSAEEASHMLNTLQISLNPTSYRHHLIK
ncbi:putative trans-2-enoyl-CoA reductase_ mitochondrial, partial [Caligus rogercresseyi]